MLLRKEFLNKPMRKARPKAVELLQRMSQAGGFSSPTYEFEMGGTPKRPSHFCKVRFRVPDFIREESDLFYPTVNGAGRCTKKTHSKSLAALDVIVRMEEGMGIGIGELEEKVEKYEEERKEQKKAIEETPIEKEIPGVSWANLPMDKNFPEAGPASRNGTINFHPGVMDSSEALTAAKAVILTATEHLPKITVHSNNTDEGFQTFANLFTGGRLEDVKGNRPEQSLHLELRNADVVALQRLHSSQIKGKTPFYANDESSFGMAKAFVKLPTHHFAELNELLGQVLEKPVYEARKEPIRADNRHHNRRANRYHDDAAMIQHRMAIFRSHQQRTKLPVDSIEKQIPHDATVTIVRGGTGSGKTTRYPLMLSLLSPDPMTRVLVAQPRRLACQTAARRVAVEQDSKIGSNGCPIGYSIRFESYPSKADGRTVDFQTPGVILRRAANDPLLGDVTHLCIDEVHERNADMDLLLALAKQAVQKRANHETLPPLRLILMSATLDSSQWETYFKKDDKDKSVVVLDVPDVRRFPIQVIHIGEQGIPSTLRSVAVLLRKKRVESYDDVICEATAQLATHVFSKNEHGNGSILCFLPGIEEIRTVERLISQNYRGSLGPNVLFLHSSLSSEEQSRVFEPGPKIILSTNLAETSVTIPDCRVVIDSGRERQFSLMDSTSLAENATVVGSQLVTVDISQAGAKQRMGRTGRVGPGTCYRLYTQETHDQFEPFSKPEMLRMDLSQLVLHTLSLQQSKTLHPLHLLLGAPDPPTVPRLRQTLVGMSHQGHVEFDLEEPDEISLTPLGRVASALPASPRIGRMLVMSLMLRSVDSAVQIAALLSVPKVFQRAGHRNWDWEHVDTSHTSDIVQVLELYQQYLKKDPRDRFRDDMHSQFRQVVRVEQQLEHSLKSLMHSAGIDVTGANWAAWNENRDRVGALVALICGASPHIAHLVTGKNNFATRDVSGRAQIFPGSVNASPKRRVHWYLYHELRTTKESYLHVTTAASPLDLALFCEASDFNVRHGHGAADLHGDEYIFIADQWVPVAIPSSGQRVPFIKLRRLLTHDMLQRVSQEPKSVLEDEIYQRIVLFVISALEQQRSTKL